MGMLANRLTVTNYSDPPIISLLQVRDERSAK